MSLLSFVTRPRLPRNAIALGGQDIAIVGLRRRGRRFVATSVAYETLPPGLCVPSFERPNVPNPEMLAAAIDRAVEVAGLGRHQRWSVLLPEPSIKTLTVSLESIPATRDELSQVLDWKVERLTGTPAADLVVSRQFVVAGKTPRFLVVAMRKAVLADYDKLFETLDWRVGLVVPRFVGEISWLDWDAAPGDKLVLGARDGGWTAVFVRKGEVLLVRPIDSDPSTFEDEIFRLALYYRDRIAESPERPALTRVMTCGPADASRLAEVIGNALGVVPELTSPVPGLLDVSVPASALPTVTAAAGLAAQAWSR